MKIIFTELFKNECQNKFQITEDQAKQVITTPDKQQIVKFDDLELRFFVKIMLEDKGEYWLLVCTRLESDNLIVQLAFRIPSEFVEEVKIQEPNILLQKLALKFGLPIRVGDQIKKFIFRESIIIKSSPEITKLVEVLNPENHSLMQSIYIKIDQEGDIKIAKCALAFCIDLNKYLSWLNA